MPTNPLIHEKSPYLLQHAHNPVNWYAWGEEAFRRAREEAKPIFLSIGYSTCHWCHVMERESFENEAIAEILNRNFVPIKVDREERPDVDRIYMLFVQATTGSGGWPMSVFLMPDLRPFFGGTYFPPERRWNHPGFREVLERVAEAWKLDHDRIVESGQDVLDQLRRHSDVVPSAAALDPAVLESAFYAFRRSFDTRHGGFGGAPKFPRPSVHNFLLRHYWRTRNLEAMEMVFATLNAMAHGGIDDRLGGGFHRYSVDERWFLPHFEKMLYDQAQLVVSYLEGRQLSNDDYYAEVARATLDYVRRDMTSPEGGFYSAEDADSVIDPARPEEKGEGAYYVWSKVEIEEALGHPACDWFSYRDGVEEQGNVVNDPHAEFAGKNILFEAHTIEDTAKHFGRPIEEMRTSLAESRRKLLAARGRRVRPHLDDKILTSWNGLMISAFAKGAQVLEDPAYEQAARRAADFVLGTMYRPRDRSLLRRYREGDAAIAGFLDDYALFVQGLIDLYETVFEIRYLQSAIELTEAMLERFEDREHGGFFSTAGGANDLVLRIKDDYDGAEPSGNSTAALNLLRLAQFTGREAYREAAERTMRAVASRIAAAPEAVPQMLAAVEFSLAAPKQIVVAGERGAEDTRALLGVVNRRFVPHKVVILLDEGSHEFFAAHLGSARGMERLGGRATAYVCENYACRLPVNDPAALDRQLAPVKQVEA